MKRFLLFGGYQYYPSGGMRDLRGDFDTLEEAEKAATRGESMIAESGYDWWHVLDTETMEVVSDRIDYEMA